VEDRLVFHAGGGENIDDKVRLEIMRAETEKKSCEVAVKWMVTWCEVPDSWRCNPVALAI
jgi:hypothetical protein